MYRFECPQCEDVQYRTMTELVSHCNEHHHDIKFGLCYYYLHTYIIYKLHEIYIYLGMQYHEFDNSHEFLAWKENEEAVSHTFYVLHNQPYVMSSSDNEGNTSAKLL